MMSIHQTIKASFDRSFGLYRDLVESIDEGALSSKLPQLPSNSIGHQVWCVIGARESYSKAISADQWSGFSCSLEEPHSRARVGEALARSEKAVMEALPALESCTDTQSQLIIDLLEHEAAHQGQLIRYLYGLKLAIPQSWKSRYALS